MSGTPSEEARPHAVAVVLRGPDGRYLFVRRARGRPAPGYWTPLTGRLEAGEDAASAAVREALEEVGLRVRVVGELQRGLAEGANYHLTWVDARLEDPTAAPALRLAPDEVDAAAWLRAADAPRLSPMFAATRALFARLAAEGAG